MQVERRPTALVGSWEAHSRVVEFCDGYWGMGSFQGGGLSPGPGLLVWGDLSYLERSMAGGSGQGVWRGWGFCI